jgi:hypothetical protein
VKELEVVVDVRPSPDSPELIVVKQKLVVNGDDLHPVGPPSEQRIGMAIPRARLSLSMLVSGETSNFLLVRVDNIGLVPLQVTRVTFEYTREQPPEETGQPGGAIPFIPSERVEPETIPVGGRREWYLPTDAYEEMRGLAARLSPDRYRIAAYAELQEVGTLPGFQVREWLDLPAQLQKPLLITGLARTALDSLPAEERERIVQSVIDLVRKGLENGAADAIPLSEDHSVYLLRVPPDWQAFVRRWGSRGVEFFHLVREATLKPYLEQTLETAAQG